MTIKELLGLDCKISSVEEFFSLLYDQNIHPAFKVFRYFDINFKSLEGMSVYLISVGEDNYFKLCFLDAPFLIYKVDKNTDVEFCWLIDFELYVAALKSCVKAVDQKYIPVIKDINKRIS